MIIRSYQSHLNGFEHLCVHNQPLWDEICQAIDGTEATERTGGAIGPAQRETGSPYSPDALLVALGAALRQVGFREISPGRPGEFVKERVGVSVQFTARPYGPYDLYAQHMAFFVGDLIDVGIEILPMKEMQSQMSSGVSYYEGELYNLIREGRGVPAVPLVLVGIAP